ncbi:Dfp1/Him1, central region-domain-containing protein [Whalleya microplaca]|nr:Dfp1/Him1, central region-domain-containing protein [Whalleya microplaca]
MAAVSLSPTPIPFSAMSGRRVPLSSNQNVANSPLRASAAAKQKRSLAQLQREDPYGQPPPAKKQIVESSTHGLTKSPSKQQRVARSQIPVQSRRNTNSYESKLAKERSGTHHHPQYHHHNHQQAESLTAKYTQTDVEEILTWKNHHRARFPKLVFYFEKVPDDVHKKLAKQVASLGAREAAFFSIEITHVVTTRSIPSLEKNVSQRDEQETTSGKHAHHDQPNEQEQEQEQEQVKTINPSLLTRLSEASSKRRTLEHEMRAARKTTSHIHDETLSQPKRNMDVLLRAREMGKKIWSLDKLQRMMDLLLEPDPYLSADIAYGSRSASRASHAESRTTEDRNLLRLLHNERVNGPSDRDPTVNARELHYFKGPYIYVYDIEEKQKPVMVREYNKVADKAQGEWPQFRTAALGRCPFIDEYEIREDRPEPKPKQKPPVVKAAMETKPVLEPPKMAPPKPVIGKRSLGEMEHAHNRGSSVTSIELANPLKSLPGKNADFRSNAFTGRPATGRLMGGEPVASGVQPSNVTSAIRSQMVSSTAATPGVITGLSKEVYGLQRQVLQRNSTATSQDLSSRRNAETSFPDDSSAKRSLTLGRTSSRKLGMIDENPTGKVHREETRAVAHAEKRAAAKKKCDLRPGYCENCAEKYEDFDEHIVSKKHRRFAEDDDNWVELDDLLSLIEREPRRRPFSSRTSSFQDS